MGSRDMIWSLVATALCTVLGYLYMDMQSLRDQVSATTATRFTAQNGAEVKELIITTNQRVRDDITDVTADIDKRMAVIETHIQYLAPPSVPEGATAVRSLPSPAAATRSYSPPPSNPEPAQQPLRRYDLRRPKEHVSVQQMPQQLSLPRIPEQRMMAQPRKTSRVQR